MLTHPLGLEIDPPVDELAERPRDPPLLSGAVLGIPGLGVEDRERALRRAPAARALRLLESSQAAPEEFLNVLRDHLAAFEANRPVRRS